MLSHVCCCSRALRRFASAWHYELTRRCISSILNAAPELGADRVEEADMPTPFPGMDPYLERPGLWREVHTRLIVAIADVLGPMVRPPYRVAVEQRSYLAMLTSDEAVIVPDVSVTNGGGTSSSSSPQPSRSPTNPEPGVFIAELPMPEEITERYLEIRDATTHDVITSIDLLSPTNKQRGKGRRLYEEQRLNVLSSMNHLVEIDLLRTGTPMPMRTSVPPPFDYSIVVSRVHQRPKAEVRLFRIRQPIPSFPIPLRRNETEPILDLNAILHDLYDRAGYDLAIDYRNKPIPPLSQDDEEWAEALLQEKGLR